MRSLAIVIALTGSAAADTVYSEQMVDPKPTEPVDHEPFISLDAYGKFGVGFAIDEGDAMSSERTTPAANYDYNLRFGKTLRATDFWRPGGFVEIHSFDFETFDAAIGPQVQLRLGDQLAVQLRGGVGAGSEGTHAVAGVQFGNWIIGASINARRSFDTGDVVVSVNVELMALIPVALGIALAEK